MNACEWIHGQSHSVTMPMMSKVNEADMRAAFQHLSHVTSSLTKHNMDITTSAEAASKVISAAIAMARLRPDLRPDRHLEFEKMHEFEPERPNWDLSHFDAALKPTLGAVFPSADSTAILLSAAMCRRQRQVKSKMNYWYKMKNQLLVRDEEAWKVLMKPAKSW